MRERSFPFWRGATARPQRFAVAIRAGCLNDRKELLLSKFYHSGHTPMKYGEISRGKPIPQAE